MNAHINRDLPVALVTTCRELGLDPREGSPQHADFERVDALLARVERHVKSAYVTGRLASDARFANYASRAVAKWLCALRFCDAAAMKSAPHGSRSHAHDDATRATHRLVGSEMN